MSSAGSRSSVTRAAARETFAVLTSPGGSVREAPYSARGCATWTRSWGATTGWSRSWPIHRLSCVRRKVQKRLLSQLSSVRLYPPSSEQTSRRWRECPSRRPGFPASGSPVTEWNTMTEARKKLICLSLRPLLQNRLKRLRRRTRSASAFWARSIWISTGSRIPVCSGQR